MVQERGEGRWHVRTESMQSCEHHHRPDNPLFLPETNRGPAGAANIFYALGEQAAIDFSPFAIDGASAPENAHLLQQSSDRAMTSLMNSKPDMGASYSVLAGIAPVLLEAQAKRTANGLTLSKEQ